MIAAFLRRFRQDRRGVILVEFALAMPVFVIMILGGVEVARYVLLQQKLNGVASTMADLVAQTETLSEAELTTLFTAVDFVAQPFELGANGVVIVSSVGATNGDPPRINWQRSGAGSLTATSQIGAEGDTPNLPADFVIRDGESVIIAEVFFEFTPFIGEQFVPPRQVYHRAMLRPRFGTLETLG